MFNMDMNSKFRVVIGFCCLWLLAPHLGGEVAASERLVYEKVSSPVPLTEDGPVNEPHWIAYGAYKKAAERAECRVDAALLAGIGFVETKHGTHGGTSLGLSGKTLENILGPRLDGRPGTRVIRDSDGGRLDGDVAFDRAVGPMQFIPTSWQIFGRDGDGDGVADPHDIDDAAAAAAAHLCGGDASLDLVSAESDIRSAVLGYNKSSAYYRQVIAARDFYRGLL